MATEPVNSRNPLASLPPPPLTVDTRLPPLLARADCWPFSPSLASPGLKGSPSARSVKSNASPSSSSGSDRRVASAALPRLPRRVGSVLVPSSSLPPAKGGAGASPSSVVEAPKKPSTPEEVLIQKIKATLLKVDDVTEPGSLSLNTTILEVLDRDALLLKNFAKFVLSLNDVLDPTKLQIVKFVDFSLTAPTNSTSIKDLVTIVIDLSKVPESRPIRCFLAVNTLREETLGFYREMADGYHLYSSFRIFPDEKELVIPKDSFFRIVDLRGYRVPYVVGSDAVPGACRSPIYCEPLSDSVGFSSSFPCVISPLLSRERGLSLIRMIARGGFSHGDPYTSHPLKVDAALFAPIKDFDTIATVKSTLNTMFPELPPDREATQRQFLFFLKKLSPLFGEYGISELPVLDLGGLTRWEFAMNLVVRGKEIEDQILVVVDLKTPPYFFLAMQITDPDSNGYYEQDPKTGLYSLVERTKPKQPYVSDIPDYSPPLFYQHLVPVDEETPFYGCSADRMEAQTKVYHFFGVREGVVSYLPSNCPDSEKITMTEEYAVRALRAILNFGFVSPNTPFLVLLQKEVDPEEGISFLVKKPT